MGCILFPHFLASCIIFQLFLQKFFFFSFISLYSITVYARITVIPIVQKRWLHCCLVGPQILFLGRIFQNTLSLSLALCLSVYTHTHTYTHSLHEENLHYVTLQAYDNQHFSSKLNSICLNYFFFSNCG